MNFSPLLLLTLVDVSLGGKILAFLPLHLPSHHHLFERIVIEMARRGHQVTYLTPFIQSKPVENLNEVYIPNYHPNLTRALLGNKDDAGNVFKMRSIPQILVAASLSYSSGVMAEMYMAIPEVQSFLKTDEKFDVVIGGVTGGEAVLAGFSQRFKTPMIALATFMPSFGSNYNVGNPAPASYIPEAYIGYTSKMTFPQRLYNFIFGSIVELSHRLYHLRTQDKIMRRYFGETLPPFEEIIKNVSLVLVNHHHSLGFPRPLLPNIIEIGGFHVKPPKPLPDDLQKYMDESKGVILFSMGSSLKSSLMPERVRKDILKAFSRLKEDVLWKFEDDSFPDLPKNVKIVKWLPQSDILVHPNLKLFITHGGLLSTIETVYRGVPVIGIPIVADQPVNMFYVFQAGYGITLEFEKINEENFYGSIMEILNNPKYRENVKKGSELLRDTPLPAMETAAFWIEYVMIHKGAKHLRSSAQDLNWFQLHLLDVLGTLLIAFALLIAINFYVLKFIANRVKNSKLLAREKVQNLEQKKQS